MRLRYLKNVATIQLDVDRCIGCRMCTQVCPHEVLVLRAQKASLIDRDACMECGACMRNCPVDALSVRPGVGCVAAFLIGFIQGTEPTCECRGGTSCCG